MTADRNGVFVAAVGGIVYYRSASSPLCRPVDPPEPTSPPRVVVGVMDFDLDEPSQCTVALAYAPDDHTLVQVRTAPDDKGLPGAGPSSVDIIGLTWGEPAIRTVPWPHEGTIPWRVGYSPGTFHILARPQTPGSAYALVMMDAKTDRFSAPAALEWLRVGQCDPQLVPDGDGLVLWDKAGKTATWMSEDQGHAIHVDSGDGAVAGPCSEGGIAVLAPDRKRWQLSVVRRDGLHEPFGAFRRVPWKRGPDFTAVLPGGRIVVVEDWIVHAWPAAHGGWSRQCDPFTRRSLDAGMKMTKDGPDFTWSYPLRHGRWHVKSFLGLQRIRLRRPWAS